MNSSNAEVQSIRLVADSWTAAVHTGNIEQLGELMTDDIVVIHRNGRTVSEKSAVMEDFAHSLRTFSIQQTVESEEIIVAGEWAFDRANVHTAICSREGGDAKHFDSNSVTILRKESGGWCVAQTWSGGDGQRNSSSSRHAITHKDVRPALCVPRGQ